MSRRTLLLIAILIAISLIFSSAAFAQRYIPTYDHQQIVVRSFQANQAQIDTATNQASAADREYKQNKNYREAAELYRQAVNDYPRAEWFFDLGNCLYFLGVFKESMRAFSAAAFMDYRDAHYAYYNAACTASLVGDAINGYTFLGLAIRSGFEPESHVYNDSDLSNIRESKMFASVIDEAKNPQPVVRSEILGQWINEPMVPSQMPGNFNFCPDGTYSYNPAETHPDAPESEFPEKAYKGAYRLEDGFLYLTVDEVPNLSLRIALAKPYTDSMFGKIRTEFNAIPFWYNGPPREPYCEPFKG